MEEGSLRCDANVSVRRAGTTTFGVKAEIKNLNSFRHVQRALEYEIDRQVAALEAGGTVEHETRLWDPAAGRTLSMRSKEDAHDYRYFPEPDLPPLQIEVSAIEERRRSLPELPDARRRPLRHSVWIARLRRRPVDAVARAGNPISRRPPRVRATRKRRQTDHGRADPQAERARRRIEDMTLTPEALAG